MLRNSFSRLIVLFIGSNIFLNTVAGLQSSTIRHASHARVARFNSSSSIEHVPDSHSSAASAASISYFKNTTLPDPTFITSHATETLFSVIFTPAPNATNIAQAKKCWNEIMTWRNQSASFYNERIVGRTWSFGPLVMSDTVKWSSSTTIYPKSVSTYKLCDGTPRADVRPITHHFSGNSTTSYTVTVPQTPLFSSQPCTPDPEMCRIWYYDSDIQQNDEHELVRQCGLPAHQGAPCLIGGGPVQLVYFPVPTAGGNLCNNNGTTLPAPSITGDPPVVTTLGHTFTSGSVYISFKSLFASYDGFWDRIGPTFSDFILPLPSSAVSTQCGGWGNAHGPGTPLNYADLNWPVPASAYSCQDRCSVIWTSDCPTCSWYHAPDAPECKTIWSDVDPVLAVPTQARDLVPEWSTCSFWDLVIPNFWFDPPIALQEQPGAQATPTMPTTSVMSTAVPRSSVEDGLPTNTAASHDSGTTRSVGEGPGRISAMPSISTVTGGSNNPRPSKATSDGNDPAESVNADPKPDPAQDPNQSLDPDRTQGPGGRQKPDPTRSPGQAPAISMPALSIMAGALSSTFTESEHAMQTMLSRAHSIADSVLTTDGSRQAVPFSPVSTRSRAQQANAVTVVSAGSLTMTESALGPNAVVIEGTALSEGGPEATVSGHTISYGPSGLVWLRPKDSSATQGSLPPVVTAENGASSTSIVNQKGSTSKGSAAQSSMASSNGSLKLGQRLWWCSLISLAVVSVLYT